MKSIIFIIFLLLVLFDYSFSQCVDCEFKDGEIWVLIDQDKVIVTGGMLDIRDKNIIDLFKEYSAENFRQVFPYSKKEYLQRVYKIKFTGETDDFVKKLEIINKGQFEKIIKRPKEIKITLYDPSDWMWYAHSEDWLWHLSSIQADLAWDITKGDTSIKIGLIDTWFDVNHPDLEQKISPHYDPYDLTWYSTNCSINNHGTTVASFAAAHTDGGGQLPGIGFNCMMICYQAWDLDYLERAHDASLRMNVDVLTSSAGGWDCRSSSLIDTVEQEAVEEIIDNGTIIVMPAGNGPTGTHCRLYPDTIDSPYFPLHPVYDTNIIMVTSIGVDNRHFYYDSIKHNREETHSHYPEVDICSPGYNVMGATCTEHDTCDPGTCCVTNPWPYYGSCIGTSFATPIVAGVCALMKSINPCIMQSEAQYIIKSTADPVNDELQYFGLIGAGRINAYEAVKEAGTRRIENVNLTSSQIYSGGYAIYVENVNIQNDINVTFKARKEIVINGPFEVELGSTLYVYIDESAQNDCN